MKKKNTYSESIINESCRSQIFTLPRSETFRNHKFQQEHLEHSQASEGMLFSHLNLSRASNNILTGRFITIFAISSQSTTNLYNFYRIRVFSMPGDFLTRTCIREKEDQDSEKRRPSCPDSLPDGFGSQMRKKS